jgi:hypothetical protein
MFFTTLWPNSTSQDDTTVILFDEGEQGSTAARSDLVDMMGAQGVHSTLVSIARGRLDARPKCMVRHDIRSDLRLPEPFDN